ncbi:thermonuclease family protein [Sphingopyxis macrogoltabida]|uniref:thermonuclease family protein n=1 Tax=Sphingopyxis macrogoltabida TaxID=33050 RepID=UPI0009E7DC3B|nr:thermonuclease family protein [Sphingopyxis macrogoltabida]
MLEALALCLGSVHDGDSLRLCDGTRVRLVALSGPVDAPELPGSPRCNRCDPRAGYAARDRLRVILSQPAKLHCTGSDKYGRRLCRVTVNGRDVGDQLVAEGLAVIRSDWR